jgi:hypothetical protein
MRRQPDFSTRPGQSRRAGGWEALALGVAALLLLASAARTVQALREARASQAAVADLRREVVEARARLSTLEGRRRSDLLTSQLVLTAEAPPGRVLAELAELLPPDARLESVLLGYGARLEIDAEVVARRPASYDLLLERLQASQSFSDIQPGPEARQGEIRATLRMTRAGVP